MNKDWIEVELGEVCNVVSGKSQKHVENSDGKYPIYGSGGKIGYADEYICEAETTIIGRKGTINSPIFVNERFWNIDTAFGIYRKHPISPKYLHFFCLHFNFKKLDKSTAVPSLAKRDILKINFPLAPPPEQRAIVAKIEQLFSELDIGIANLKTAQQKLTLYKQAVLKKAFEGGFTEEWRKKQGIEKGENESGLPTGWKNAEIETLLSGKKGMTTGPFGTALRKSEHEVSGIPVLGIENIGDGIFKMPNKIFVNEEKASELTSFQVLESDIIISRSGTVGEICSVPKKMSGSIISTNLIRVRLNRNKILPDFFVYLFQGGGVKQQVKDLCKGSTRAFLNQTILKSIDFPLPPLPEQDQIVQEIESRLSVCDKVQETISQNLAKAEALRQSILKKAFSGNLLTEKELSACRNVADYAPASELIKEIVN